MSKPAVTAPPLIVWFYAALILALGAAVLVGLFIVVDDPLRYLATNSQWNTRSSSTVPALECVAELRLASATG